MNYDYLLREFQTTFQEFVNELPIILFLLFVFFTPYIIKRYKYKKTSYYKITHKKYSYIKKDIGSWGEYLTFKELHSYENSGGKLLFNIYIPKEDGKTTEIDVLLINSKGIFVFESKNYSGWIFGNERQKMWTQTFRSHKEHFFNPIMQNKGHIKSLKTLIEKDIDIYSIIVFSERCSLVDITINDNHVKVVHRKMVSLAVEELSKLSVSPLNQIEIDELYKKLYPYTQVSEDIKINHIEDIKGKYFGDELSSNTEATKKAEIIDESIDLKNSNAKGQQKEIIIAEDTKLETQKEVITNKENEVMEESQEFKITESVAEKESQQDIIELVTDETSSLVQEINIDKGDTKTIFQQDNQTGAIKNENIASNSLKCPLCGGKLVLRTARRGLNSGNQFYGCSNYPKCKYIKNI